LAENQLRNQNSKMFKLFIFLFLGSIVLVSSAPLVALTNDTIKISLIYPLFLENIAVGTLQPFLFRVAVNDASAHNLHINLERLTDGGDDDDSQTAVSTRLDWPWKWGGGKDNSSTTVVVKQLGKLTVRKGTWDYSMVWSVSQDEYANLATTTTTTTTTSTTASSHNLYVITMKQGSRWGWRQTLVYQTAAFRIVSPQMLTIQ
jgi:hypothetical protein